MKTHELKIWPGYFAETVHGEKAAQLRKNDRKYAVGDKLRLREYDPKLKRYSGKETTVTVTNIIERCAGLTRGWCILSIKLKAGDVCRFVPELAGVKG